MMIQVLFSVIILIFLFRTWERKKKSAIITQEAVWWSLFWLLAAGVLWIPDSTTRVANLLGIGRGADLVSYVGLLVLFYMIFRAYVRMEKMERDITKLVRKIALDEHDDKQLKK